MNDIYLITVISNKGKRCVGWFKTWDEAKEVVEENQQDIWNGFYEYAVIEKIPEGLFKLPASEHWYSWYEGKYVETGKPKKFMGMTNYSVG